MSKANNLTDFLTDLANTIRTKKGTTAKINPQNFSSEITSIDTRVAQSKTVSPSTSKQTITPDADYNCLSQVTVNAISPTKGAQTFIPGTSNKTISSGRWLTGDQTIKGDSNLIASNIISGVTIFNVVGTALRSFAVPIMSMTIDEGYDSDDDYYRNYIFKAQNTNNFPLNYEYKSSSSSNWITGGTISANTTKTITSIGYTPYKLMVRFTLSGYMTQEVHYAV